jgi:hypothetical protein
MAASAAVVHGNGPSSRSISSRFIVWCTTIPASGGAEALRHDDVHQLAPSSAQGAPAPSMPRADHRPAWDSATHHLCSRVSGPRPGRPPACRSSSTARPHPRRMWCRVTPSLRLGTSHHSDPRRAKAGYPSRG